MERSTHILFTITWIYWLSLVLKTYQIEHELAIWYILIISSFPLISIPFQAIVTSLPDADLHNSRFNKTILGPALSILSFFVNHRWVTHRLSWILLFSVLMLILYIIWTNIITLTIISFLAITIIWVLIDDFKLKILWIGIKKIWFWKKALTIDTKLIDKLLSTLIIVFFPILLIPEVYWYFLGSLVLGYIFHMFWDAFSKEWWTILKIPFSEKELKFQLPKWIAFRVWWWFERKIIKPLLWITLIFIFIIDYKFWGDKIMHDLSLVFYQVSIIYNNPELLISDIDSIKDRINSVAEFIRKILT